MINNYNEFLLESLILESQIEFSKKFLDLIKGFEGDPITSKLVQLYNSRVDKDYIQNYVDISKVKDEVTFTVDKKAIDYFSKSDSNKWRVTIENKTLTNSNRNGRIFSMLGYPKRTGEQYQPEINTVGKIKAEIQSPYSERIFVWFESDAGQETVMDKAALVQNDESGLIWSKFRNNMKVGRLVRGILTSAGIDFAERDIETFVNKYKSQFDIVNDGFKLFELVKGDDIAKWYSYENYYSLDSTLGNSCMRSVYHTYFNIYCKNSNCSLLVLFSDDTKMKIKGRALVWKTVQGDIFMDRIYTNSDSDVNMFIKYSQYNGWWRKMSQTSSSNFNVTDGNIQKNVRYSVQLEESKFTKYPYMDSLKNINFKSKLISNNQFMIDADGFMEYTNGSYFRYE